MTKILTWPEIETVIEKIDVVHIMAEAFKAYSQGSAVIPPVGELQFENPPGDVHIKYGYLLDGSHYVVKIASGFYENPQLGLSSSQGLMLLFCQKTGQLQAVLLDEGKLTDIRTAGAGALSVQLLAPPKVQAIGMIGTGIQAQEQLKQIAQVHPCRKLNVWGRTPNNVKAYTAFAHTLGFQVVPTLSRQELVENSQVIVTTTPSTEALIYADWVRPGTLITAIGADTPLKQELDSRLLEKADLVVSDSLSQAKTRGEVYRAVQQGHLESASVIELGTLLFGRSVSARDEGFITVVDLTGVAVQDLAIASAVVRQLGL